MIPTNAELSSDHWRESCGYWGDALVIGSFEQFKNNFAQTQFDTQPIHTGASIEHVKAPPENILNTILNRLEVEFILLLILFIN
jgi:hypothetical protein